MKKIIILLVLLITYIGLFAQEKQAASNTTISAISKTINKKKVANTSASKLKNKTIVTKQGIIEVKQEPIEELESQTIITKKQPNALPIAPMYKDGKKAMLNFIADNLKVPTQLKKNAETLIVTVTFKVSANGQLTDIKARQTDAYGCHTEAERIVKLMPNWVAGRVGRNFVEMPMAIDIEFK